MKLFLAVASLIAACIFLGIFGYTIVGDGWAAAKEYLLWGLLCTALHHSLSAGARLDEMQNK